MLLRQLRRVRWAVRATLILGVAASVVANVLHALDNPISQAIAAWPPLALLLTVELISRVPVHRRWLAAARLIATAAIAGIAAWVSYWHMAGVASRYGETGASPYLLPLSVDGLIVVASSCLVELGGRITGLERPAEEPVAVPAAPAQAAPAPAAPAPTAVVPVTAPILPEPISETVPAAARTATEAALRRNTGSTLSKAAEDLRRSGALTGNTDLNPVVTRQPRTPAPARAVPATTARTVPATSARAVPATSSAPRRATATARAVPTQRTTAPTRRAKAAAMAAEAAATTDPEPARQATTDKTPTRRAAADQAPADRVSAADQAPADQAGAADQAPADRAGAANEAPADRAGAADQAPTQRPARNVTEIAARAKRIVAERPSITDAELAAELGISLTRLRSVREANAA